MTAEKFFMYLYIGFGLFIIVENLWFFVFHVIKRIYDMTVIRSIYGPKPASDAELEEKLDLFWQNEQARYAIGNNTLSPEQLARKFKRHRLRIVDTLYYIAGRPLMRSMTGVDRKPFRMPWSWVAFGYILGFLALGESIRKHPRKFKENISNIRDFYVQKVLHAKPKAALEENIHGSAKMADGSDLGPEYTTPGGIPLGPGLWYHGERHLFMIALSRTGKGRDVQIPTLLEYPASTIIVDPKGQLAAVTARRRREMGHEVFIINPFSSELSFLPSHGFNPLAILNPANEDRFVEDVRRLSQSIIVDTGDAKSSHFVSSARALLAGFIMHVVLNEPEKTLGMVRSLIALPPAMRRDMVEQMTQSDFQPLREQVGRFLGEAQEIENHFSTLDDQTVFIGSPAIRRCLSTDSGLRFGDMKQKDITVYIVLPTDYLETQGRFLRLVITAALSELYKSTLPKGRLPVLFMLDEFPALGHMENIKAAVGAAAGYGVQIWPIVQNLPQLKDNYPKGWETFIDNAGALQILGTNDNTTKEYFSKKAGNKTVKKASESESIGADGRPTMGTSIGETGMPLIEPLEFGRLGDDEQFEKNRQIVFLYGPGPLEWPRKPYFIQNKYAGLYDPDPYYKK